MKKQATEKLVNTANAKRYKIAIALSSVFFLLATGALVAIMASINQTVLSSFNTQNVTDMSGMFEGC